MSDDLTWSMAAWEAMTHQEQARADKAEARARALEAVLVELTAAPSFAYRHWINHTLICNYCGVTHGHAANCPVARARALLSETNHA